MLNVWYIYLHVPKKIAIHVGKYTIYIYHTFTMSVVIIVTVTVTLSFFFAPRGRSPQVRWTARGRSRYVNLVVCFFSNSSDKQRGWRDFFANSLRLYIQKKNEYRKCYSRSYIDFLCSVVFEDCLGNSKLNNRWTKLCLWTTCDHPSDVPQVDINRDPCPPGTISARGTGRRLGWDLNEGHFEWFLVC